MQLYILGKNRDGKGTALEELTGAILSQLGYKVVRNYIGYGGHEIDVEAQYEQEVLGEKKVIPVVCECKAHDKPIVIGDWLKFLGKVLVERMNNAQTMGVMIALSGANGNVQSNYDKLPDKSYLSLICNDQLTSAVGKHYKLKSIDEIRSFVEHKTVRAIDTINLVYYEKEIWWLVGFVHGEFTVLSDRLAVVDDKYLDDFLNNLQDVSSYSKDGYKDILREEIGRIRTEIIARTIVLLLMKNREMSVDELLEQTKRTTHQPDIDINELIKTIEDYPCFEMDEDGDVRMREFDIEGMMEFYRWYLSGQFIVDSIVCDYYRGHINNELLDRIVELQNNIELSEEQKQDCLFILRLSPSALMYALHPDSLITRSRNESTANVKEFNKFHTERFVNSLTDNFITDLENGQYYPFYYREYGLSGYNIENRLKLKFRAGVEDKNIDYQHRIGLFEYEGQIVPTVLFNNQ